MQDITECPRCNGILFEVAPAEPDVGIMVALLACKLDGQCFFDDRDGEWYFIDDQESR